MHVYFTGRIFIPHKSPPLQTESGTWGHPAAPFPRPGPCSRILFRASNNVGGTERNEVGKERGRVGSGVGNDDGDGDGAGAGTGVGTRY